MGSKYSCQINDVPIFEDNYTFSPGTNPITVKIKTQDLLNLFKKNPAARFQIFYRREYRKDLCFWLEITAVEEKSNEIVIHTLLDNTIQPFRTAISASKLDEHIVNYIVPDEVRPLNRADREHLALSGRI